jgi:DNA-binding response OmpR family regulator
MASPPVVVLIEDDETIGENLSRALDGPYRSHWARTGAEGIEAAAEADLIILDLGLPDVHGLDVCRFLTAHWPRVPVLILTAQDEEVQIVAGLEAGAVDYVNKPFRLAELKARIRAHLRTIATAEPTDLEVGEVRVDAAARRVLVAGHEVDLRPKELDLLLVLLERAGTVVTRDELMRLVWDEHWHGSTKTLDVHMASLRRALRHDGTPACTITTLRGVGFRLERP